MEEQKKQIIINVFNFLMNIFLFLIGVFIILLGMSLMNALDAEAALQSSTAAETTDWIMRIPMILSTSGIIVMLYSVKRLVKSYLNI